jgi:CheY-like chemotaxis protein
LKHILIVDDEEINRSLIQDMLGHMLGKAFAISCHLAENGIKAQEYLTEYSMDLVLCDLHMGRGPNGLEVLEYMRDTLHLQTPFILLTGSDEPEVLERLDELDGMHMQKPVGLQIIGAACRSFLEDTVPGHHSLT